MNDNSIDEPTEAKNMCSKNGFFDSLTEDQATKFYEALKEELD